MGGCLIGGVRYPSRRRFRLRRRLRRGFRFRRRRGLGIGCRFGRFRIRLRKHLINRSYFLDDNRFDRAIGIFDDNSFNQHVFGRINRIVSFSGKLRLCGFKSFLSGFKFSFGSGDFVCSVM